LNERRSEMRSSYMHWVKTLPPAQINLANSGVRNYSLSELPVDFQSLTLCGPGAYGYPPLLDAIANKCGVDPNCVATALGTSMANHLAMAAAVDPGDEVLIELPGYPLLWETAEYVGASVRFFERLAETGFAVNLDQLRRLVTPRTRLIVLTNLHNPSCALLDQSTLSSIGELAQSVNARVLIDEVYLDLLFDNIPETSFKLGPSFVVTNSLTKVYGLSGLRCGWILADPDLIGKIHRMNDLFGVNNPYVTDQLSCIALAHLPQIAAWSRKLLDANRALAAEFITTAPAIICEPPRYGTVIFPRLNQPASQFCRHLREQYDVIVTPADFFGAPDRIRIGIGGDTAMLTVGLEKIREALSA